MKNGILHVILLAINIFCCTAVTDKQYASMPALFHTDDFDKCMLLEDEALYCSFMYKLEPLNDESNASETWKIIKEASSDRFSYRHDHLRHWICVPFTCPAVQVNESEDSLKKRLTDCYNEKFQPMGLKGTINNLKCETTESKFKVDFIDASFMLLLICYISFIVFASFYEGLARYKQVNEHKVITNTSWAKIISAFSIPKNWDRLKTIKSAPDVERLRYLQGIRFYHTLLVITCHTSLYYVTVPVLNTKYSETMNKKVLHILLSSGSLAVTTFFQMTSFLMVFGIFSHFENKKLTLKNLVEVFVSRYLRLVPTLAAVLAFNIILWRHLERGPYWNNYFGKEAMNCRKNWWMNLLFINNLVDMSDMCLIATWSLSLDVQYFIFLLLIIWFMKKYQAFIWPVLTCILSLNIIGTFIQNYVNNFEAFIVYVPESLYEMNFLKSKQWQIQYAGIIGNSAGPIIGLFYGYLYYKNRNKEVPKSEESPVLFHVLSYVVPFGTILIPGTYLFLYQGEHDRFWASCYVALSRPIFSIGVGYSIYSMARGLGWITKYVFEWQPVYMLGRLSYSAYLCHMPLISWQHSLARHQLYLNDLSGVYRFIGNVTVAYMMAFLLTLLIEMPFYQLQKFLHPLKSDTNMEPKKED